MIVAVCTSCVVFYLRRRSRRNRQTKGWVYTRTYATDDSNVADEHCEGDPDHVVMHPFIDRDEPATRDVELGGDCVAHNNEKVVLRMCVCGK